jgi:hypothetical protein
MAAMPAGSMPAVLDASVSSVPEASIPAVPEASMPSLLSILAAAVCFIHAFLATTPHARRAADFIFDAFPMRRTKASLPSQSPRRQTASLPSHSPYADPPSAEEPDGTPPAEELAEAGFLSAKPTTATLTPTDAEWTRFLSARRGDAAAASAMWSVHAEWRLLHLPLAADAPFFGRGLPDHLVMLQARCKSGGRVLLCLAAMWDPSLGSTAEYTLAIAAFLDGHLARDSDECLCSARQPAPTGFDRHATDVRMPRAVCTSCGRRITILVDCRGGVGWPNPPPSLSHSRDIAHMLRAHFPERMLRIVVFPMPWIVSAVWLGASRALGSRAAARARLLTGTSSKQAPLPQGLSEYLGDDALAECEAAREARFKPAESAPAHPNIYA